MIYNPHYFNKRDNIVTAPRKTNVAALVGVIVMTFIADVPLKPC